MERLNIGTRGSKLARAQTELLKRALAEQGQWDFETVIIKTHGDRVQDRPISQLGGAGVFAGEVEQALTEGRIDLAVHSAKDLPSLISSGTEIRCVLERGDPRDALILRRGADLTAEPRIGTGSIRRRAGYRRLFPGTDPEFLDIRGNVDTRIEKLRRGDYDGIILAAAGLSRLGLLPFEDPELECRLMPLESFLPAPCQAIIAVQSRKGEHCGLLDRVCHPDTFVCFKAERYVLELLGGDCTKPIGAWARIEEGRLILSLCLEGEPLTARGDPLGYRSLAEELVKRL